MADWAFTRAILERGDGRGPGQITKREGGNGKGHGIVSYFIELHRALSSIYHPWES